MTNASATNDTTEDDLNESEDTEEDAEEDAEENSKEDTEGAIDTTEDSREGIVDIVDEIITYDESDMRINLTDTKFSFSMEESLNLRYIDSQLFYNSCYYEITTLISPEKQQELDSGRPYNISLDLNLVNSTEINVYLYRGNSSRRHSNISYDEEGLNEALQMNNTYSFDDYQNGLFLVAYPNED